jgi:hypothetical protein
MSWTSIKKRKPIILFAKEGPGGVFIGEKTRCGLVGKFKEGCPRPSEGKGEGKYAKNAKLFLRLWRKRKDFFAISSTEKSSYF